MLSNAIHRMKRERVEQEFEKNKPSKKRDRGVEQAMTLRQC